MRETVYRPELINLRLNREWKKFVNQSRVGILAAIKYRYHIISKNNSMTVLLLRGCSNSSNNRLSIVAVITK